MEYIPEDNNVEYSSPEEFYEKIGKDEIDEDTGLTGSEKIKIIKRAQKCAKQAHAYWDEKYEEIESDWDFYDGSDDKQWSQDALTKRKNRPTLTFNQLPKFVSKVTAESKKNPPAIKLSPRENGDRFKADIGMGLVRYIEDSCGAKYAYTHALQCAAIGGIGWVKVTYDEKNIRIKKVKDAFSWFIDPDSEESDGSDAKYMISHTRKKDGKKIIECYEYWWQEDDKVYWSIIEGNEVLEYGEFPSKYLPIVPVYGMDIQYRDNRTIKGIIRDLRDPQSTYNYMKSQEMESVAMAPKPFVAVPEGIIDAERIKDYHRLGINVLEHKSVDAFNNPVTTPNFATAQPNIAWMQQITAGAQNDMREVSGIYDTALGADTKVMSGAAIVAKTSNAEAGQYNFTENLQNSIQQIGKIVISLIKPIMGEQGMIRILGEDGQQSIINLEVPQIDPITGEPTMIDLDFDEMDISVASAPAYATRREAGAQAIQDIMQAIPEKAGILADIAVSNLDVPGAIEAAKRLKMTLPPEMQQADAGMIPQAMADQIMQVSEQTIQQQQNVINQLRTEMARLNALIETQTVTAQMDANTSLTQEAMRQAGNDRRKAMELESKSTADDKKIMADAQKQNQQLIAESQKQNQQLMAKAVGERQKYEMEITKQTIANQKPESPNSVTISNTEVNSTPKPDYALEVVNPLPGNLPNGGMI